MSSRHGFTLAAILAGLHLFVERTSAFGGDLPPGLPGPEDIFSAAASVTTILQRILTFVALAAVVVIIIAGIRLILSLGNEEGKETAKKTILYVVAGLLIILFAKAIVTFVTRGLGY